ncbi:aminoglycoside phosphotransferase family protein [Kribbella sp. NBC_01245]|uniref:phosphotransferase family protein n=1 Tax=Kribbella sp. NBC_01245 TaxID=2903578 RepID=UPI002E2DDEB1|nr:aminoglycoside phosphotransferase family protein [Kribbella sp. NBC_01245]
MTAIAQKYGVMREQVVSVPGGVANHVFMLGDELVLRIPRSADFVADLRKEVGVIPVARKAGVRTPGIVEFNESLDLIESPYLLLERQPGTDLATRNTTAVHTGAGHTTAGHSAAGHIAAGHIATPRTADGLWGELGRELDALHRMTPDSVGALAGVPIDRPGDPRPGVGDLVRRGYLDAGTARWLVGWFDRLEAGFPADERVVLVHGDIAPQNLMVDPQTGDLTGLIDWGDAAWAEPGMEFAKLRLRDVAAVLSGGRYGEVDPTAIAARALWYHLSWGVSGLAKGPRPSERHWTAPPASRLLGLLEFFANDPPAPWHALV